MVIDNAVRKVTAGMAEFLRLESAGGLLLAAAAGLALICSNTPLRSAYDDLLKIPVEVRVGSFALAKPLLMWVDDGLMAVFFLLIGLEVKREVIEGELSTPAQVVLPVAAGLAGMVVPALIYLLVNRGSDATLNGWAIPTATDIAFALGILSLLGNRVPVSLKVFLTAVAIADDLGAITIIALFYTAGLSILMLLFAALAIAVLIGLNVLKVTRIAPYMVVGVILWVFVLKSGVHATLAGVAVAFAVPLTTLDSEGKAPLHRIEHGLHPWVAFGILPIFAFANAGVPFAGVTLAALAQPLPLGIAAGLFIGKLVAVCGASAVLIGLRQATLPEGASWRQLAGVAALCGVGFTMSLFIGSLAFESPEYSTPVRLGVIVGSMLSGVTGYLLLR
ncbi:MULTISPECIES: Na+/H+ antiporter NhaA [Paraburkholderia]|uniref:Na(+)/H(+) antiporter NhaA n=1 Tax=Paraburkholderia hospita TaxID=169430 RepID=A0AAN1J8E3_9BURK|nr:Na+/H+ antiporter NhaA [Paraburkholderia hospita]AUT69102.1 Na+/H+ antiporter NhaA [Paraburkholderia hospita]EIN02359.1 Na+/H+ antiporter NhaA [Paraburkholderia hospita]OUL85146.1 Na+/H+ antiporter NhaA [Paraburkholderia hospita]OUL93325.1 Na+/H+ antiporter NhaA [Paraburkholderia hospita]OUL97341.1 Na+/H+ antiporter NhaA [Paraburkholderia hospita]